MRIELNTASHHQFAHLHLLSADPLATAEWHHHPLCLPVVGRQERKRMYHGFQVAPSATVLADHVHIIIFPLECARSEWPSLWSTRRDFEPAAGRVIDHIAFTRKGERQSLSRPRITSGSS
jgi:hypothetical protein